jgi:hypothetical protein
MLTRRTLRRALVVSGLSLGALGPLIALFTMFGDIIYIGPYRDFSIARGAIQVREYVQPRQSYPGPGPRNVAPPPITPNWSITRPTGRPWQWLPMVRASTTTDEPSRLTIPWWLLTSIGLVSLYFYLPPGYSKGHCQRCNFELANLPPDPENPARRRCPECGHLSPVRA